MPRDDGPIKTTSITAQQSQAASVRAGDIEVDPRSLLALSEAMGVPAIDLLRVRFPTLNLQLVPLEIARRHRVLPFEVRDDSVSVAMAAPNESRVIEELEFVTGRRVFPYVAIPEQLAQTIERAYACKDRGESTYVGALSTEQLDGASKTTQSASARAIPGSPKSATTFPGVVVAQTARNVSIEKDLDDLHHDPDVSSLLAQESTPELTSAIPIASPKATLLVVDDDEDIRRLLFKVLTDRGYRVLEADRGSVALQMVKQHVPDGILLDAMLPELHGFDICRRIKASERYGHIPILMLSAVYRGWRIAEDLKQAYGINDYIEKPFRISDLIASVERMLAGTTRKEDTDLERISAEAEALLRAGNEAYRQGQIAAAISHMDRATQLDPLSYKPHLHLGLLIARQGETFRAIQELETALGIHPHSFQVLKNLAVLYQKAGFRHKAIEMWERAIGQSPDDAIRNQLKEHLLSLL